MLVKGLLGKLKRIEWRKKINKIFLYIFFLLIALDQLLNVILGGFPDETISSRCYRKSDESSVAKVCRYVLDFIFSPWGKNHCEEAFKSELNRKHYSEEFGKTYLL